jgi:hypothetical protein
VVRRELDYLVSVAGDLGAPQLEEGKHDAYAWVGLSDLDLLMVGRTDHDRRLRDVVAKAVRVRLTDRLRLEPARGGEHRILAVGAAARLQRGVPKAGRPSGTPAGTGSGYPCAGHVGDAQRRTGYGGSPVRPPLQALGRIGTNYAPVVTVGVNPGSPSVGQRHEKALNRRDSSMTQEAMLRRPLSAFYNSFTSHGDTL